MKKLMGLAAAGLLVAGAANAGSLKVANSDIVLYGGVSAGYQYITSDHVARNTTSFKNNDYFSVNNVIIGLKKDADSNSPIGFNAAFGNFTVPTVIASNTVVNDVLLSSGTFQPWLAYVTIAPVQGLSVDAGLLWNKFGEAPITILNSHINRGILFTGHPVLYAGARVNYDAGVAKIYVGYNQGGGLRQTQGTPTVNNLDIDGNGTTDSLDIDYRVSDAIEAGLMTDLGVAKVGLHIYDESNGRNLYVLCAKTDLGAAKVGIEFDYTTLDDNATLVLNGTPVRLKDNGADDSAYGIAINIDPVISDQVSVPIRIEYVENGDSAALNGAGGILGSAIYLTGEGSAYSLTITPTYNPTGNTFVRAEIAYTSTDAKILVDDSGSEKDNRTYLGFEAGFLF
ncbi:outer membrane beta-barrel protein [Persephonella sp.]